MASVTIDSAATAATADGGSLRLDSIPIVDLRLLSQSELYSLSRCSSSSFDLSHRDDVVIPIIDRSVFNESAGSRKQTYSRLRLAPPSSPTSATPRRRGPHLRSTATTFGGMTTKSDPENAENAQIVNLLKQLFVMDMNPGDLVPVKIEYSNSLPIQQFSSPSPSSPSNVGLTGQKRKRGRPRRSELSGNERELAMEVGVVDVSVVDLSDAHGFSSLNEIVVRENVEERDKQVLNRDGVAVDLVALGAVEHPYWEEIHRRTEGLRTEEELLGFLKGLYGQWGSRRKKKRIVDASEFGSVLPVGWKLSLSVKKKNGHVWLYCRRYISPSGLHFVSCKGVSSYLLSLHGVQDTNLHSSAEYNEIVNDADKLTSVTIPHLAVQDDDKMENLVSHVSSPPSVSTTGNHEIQVVVNEGNLQEDRIGEILHCDKCNITFNEKDELLQHQSSVHWRNRCKNGMRITDGVIIKDGKYECQFCHKIFSERHRYNGHVGAHVRYQAKTAEESSESVDPSSFNEFPIQDVAIEGSLKSDNAVEICISITNNGLNICSPCNKNNEHIGDLEEANGSARGIDEATDIVTETNPCSVAEVRFSSNENESSHEDARLNGSAAEMIDDSFQGGRSGSSLPPLNDATHGVTNNGDIELSASVEKPEQIMASKSCISDSNDQVEECFVVNNDEHIYQIRNELKLDCEKFAANESVFDFFRSQGEGDEKIDVSVKEKSNFGFLPCKNIGTADTTSTCGSEASKLNEDSNISVLPLPHDDKACVGDNVPFSIRKFKVDEALGYGKCENESSNIDNDGVNRHEDMHFGTASVIPSWDEQENVSKKDETEALACLLKVPGVQDMSKSQVVSGHESLYHFENDNDGICRKKKGAPESDNFQNFGNGESSDPFNSSHAGISSNSITVPEQDRKLGLCSSFTSSTDKQLFTEDNMIRIFNDTVEDHRQEPSGILLMGQSGVSEVLDEAYTLNKIYAAPANPSKLNEMENTRKHELSLSFGNLQTNMCTDSNRVQQEGYQAKSFNIESVVHKTYGAPTHLSIVSSNIPGDLKQDRPFGFEFPNSSFNNRAHDLGSSFNMRHPGRDWNETRGDKLGTSGQNFMVGFGNSSLQAGECVAADGSWRTGHENMFEGCFDANSGPQIPSSSCFRTFGLTSDKGTEGSFGLNKNYDIQSDMLTPGRTKPVEYSFMGEQSSNSLPGESKIFSYSANMEQGLDPSFWLGKDALMPNASQTSQVTSVCVWCRNVFFHEPVQAGIQTGAIGTMCPSCSARIPGQFNVL